VATFLRYRAFWPAPVAEVVLTGHGEPWHGGAEAAVASARATPVG
jgi:hypothetical protein